MSNAVFDIEIINDDIFECLTECEDRYYVTPMANSAKVKED